jgi:hypothetical protein
MKKRKRRLEKVYVAFVNMNKRLKNDSYETNNYETIYVKITNKSIGDIHIYIGKEYAGAFELGYPFKDNDNIVIYMRYFAGTHFDLT